MSLRTHLAAAGFSLAVILGGAAAASADEMSNGMAHDSAMSPTDQMGMAKGDMAKEEMAKDEMSKGEMTKDEKAKEEMAKDDMAQDSMAKDNMKK